MKLQRFWAALAIALLLTIGIGAAPASHGKLVLLSIGMSNASQEFCGPNTTDMSKCLKGSFVERARRDSRVSKNVEFVNGAMGGMTSPRWDSPEDETYNRVKGMLSARGLSERDVKVVWLKSALTAYAPAERVDQATEALGRDLIETIDALRIRYPNVQQIFLSYRTYGGWALNGEPVAYETKKAVDRAVAMRSGKQVVVAWGPYLWDAKAPREDFAKDGIHPSLTGVAKVGAQLMAFFMNDPRTGWFRGETVVKDGC